MYNKAMLPKEYRLNMKRRPPIILWPTEVGPMEK